MNLVIHDECATAIPRLAYQGFLFDSVVTDPPYGLRFMGCKWDYDIPTKDIWESCLEVLKPGAHMLVFGGTRTFHRMAVAIEDAGFEIRDTLMWVYGSGFPGSHDVALAIDKAAKGVPHGGSDPTSPNHGKFKGGCSEDNEVGRGFDAGPGQFMTESGGRRDKKDLAPEAARWDGWGTRLKPAWEPIVLARKPLAGTVADNVLTYGTGGINIDGCRIGSSKQVPGSVSRTPGHVLCGSKDGSLRRADGSSSGYNPHIGRWPANLIHDGSDEVLSCFPNAKGQIARARTDGTRQGNTVYGALNHVTNNPEKREDSGSAARFFYCAKASSKDRAGSDHPTVKPLALMRYLVKLITPPGGMVLDPFAGTGTTLQAALEQGFSAIGIERDAEYVVDIRRRLASMQSKKDK